MEIHKANPFMMDDAPVSVNPFAAPAAMSVNPFLDMATTTTTSVGNVMNNPFLDGSLAATNSSPQQVSSRPYNPFADFHVDEPLAAVVESLAPQPMASNNNASDGLAWLTSGGAMQQHQVISPYDFTDPASAMDDLMAEMDLPPPPPPDVLNLPQVDELPSSSETSPIPPEVTMTAPARPAPPPRPPSRPSPPHETQQLILSVTGAMQATSDHLLDRLRAAAPSPVPGHHMSHGSHSPSPSPSPCPSPTHDVDLMHSTIDEAPRSRPLSPARPQPPRPPRPAAPASSAAVTQHPVIFDEPKTRPAASSGFASIFGTDPSPSPPAPSPNIGLGDGISDILNFAEPSFPQPPSNDPPAEDIDLLGLPKPRTRTKDDILRLFEKKEEKAQDLLAGDDLFGGDFLVDLTQQNGASVLAPVSGNTPAAPTVPTNGSDNLAALEPTLFDAPVAESLPPAGDDVTAAVESSPVHISIVNSTSSPISIPERKKSPTDDEFDAFSSRFESVGRDDCLVVESDPFDPFSAGGSAKGSSGTYLIRHL